MLLEACTDGDLPTIRRLIDEGAPVDAANHEGWTALHRASAYGHHEALEALMRAGASLPAKTVRTQPKPGPALSSRTQALVARPTPYTPTPIRTPFA